MHKVFLQKLVTRRDIDNNVRPIRPIRESSVIGQVSTQRGSGFIIRTLICNA